MRLLPSSGWIAGLFGRRDRALLAVAASTQIPYRQIAQLTVGQLRIADGAATITDSAGVDHVLESSADPVLCGPCALVRWRRLLNIPHTKTRMSDFLTDAKQVTPASHHPCRQPKPIDPRTLQVALFPPVDQWDTSRCRDGRSPPTRCRGWYDRRKPASPRIECFPSTSSPQP